LLELQIPGDQSEGQDSKDLGDCRGGNPVATQAEKVMRADELWAENIMIRIHINVDFDLDMNPVEIRWTQESVALSSMTNICDISGPFKPIPPDIQ
jgi:hypothetical protein